MITCRELVALLDDLVSDQLAPGSRVSIESHLDRCPSCVAYLESYSLTIQLSQQLPRAPLPMHLKQRLQDMLKESVGNPHRLVGTAPSLFPDMDQR